jgi:MinD superfamily P-loop ATPase
MKQKEITIISGKGGTGKTSITASFAVLSKRCVIADCDVDAPNMHILLNPQEIEEEFFFGEKKAKIIIEKCTLCGSCLNLCTFNAIEETIKNGKFQLFINPFVCDGCGICYKFCPLSAIEFNNVESAHLVTSKTTYGPIIYAKMETGSGNSGKLVYKIKEKAREMAKKENLDVILVDGPPGIGCPVISSISGSSIAIVVTEPTLSAIGDLKRIIELLFRFKVKTGVIINKYDLNTRISSDVQVFCEKNKLCFLGKIPYDPIIPKIQSDKLTPVEVEGKSSKEIKSIYEKFLKIFCKED